MKRICILAITIILIFPQAAQPAGLYWGFNLLAADFQQANLRVDMKNVPYYLPQKVSLKSKESTRACGASFLFGLDFNWAGNIPLRVELETALMQGGTIGVNQQYHVNGFIDFIVVDAEVDIEMVAAETLSLWLEPPKGLLPFRPYVGVSIGANYMPYKTELTFNKGSMPGYTADKSHYLFSLQYGLGGGAAFQIGKRAFLDLNLRYLKSDSPNTIRLAPANLQFETKSLNLSLGFKYYF